MTAPSACQWFEARRRALFAELSAGGPGVARFPASMALAADGYVRKRLREWERQGAAPEAARGCCLLAVGGYGRGRLCPHSDIDLLVLYADAIPAQAQELAQALFHPLWDMRLAVGHGVRATDECLDLASRDTQVLASLLDARRVAGDPAAWDAFSRRMDALCAALDPAAVARALEQGLPPGDYPDLFSPDLKNGPGGLRDFQRASWLARLEPGLFSARELDALRRDEDWLWAARSALHLAAGRKQDLLPQELQDGAARLMGFADAGGRLGVERFLGQLGRRMRRALRMRQAAMAALTGRPCLITTFRGSAPAGATDILDVLRRSARQGLALCWRTAQAVRERLARLGPELTAGPWALEVLLAALASPGGAALEALRDCGVLEALLPELVEVRDLKPMDPLHRHSVDDHSLLTVRRLGELAAAGGEPAALLAGLGDARPLHLAALLHDVGKARPDHAEAGAAMARRAVVRLGGGEQLARDVALLVREHLSLWTLATHGDLGDEALASRAAGLAGTVERLTRLYLLSLADAAATGPQADTPWRRALLAELYHKARRLLEAGPLAERGAAERLEANRRSVRELADQAAPGTFPPGFVSGCLASMNPRYLLNLPPERIAGHLPLVLQLRRELAEEDRQMPGGKAGRGLTVLAARRLPAAQAWELTFVAQDQPGLFATLAGVLALHGLNILAAQAATWSDRTVVDSFVVDEPADPLYVDELWTRVRMSVKWSMTGKLHLDERFRERRASPLAEASQGGAPPEVRIDNVGSDFFTQVEVRAADRLGRLYELVKPLDEMGVSVRLARIATEGPRIRDVFLVREAAGGKVQAPRRLKDLRKALLKAAR